MQLSEHFTLEEMIRTRTGLKNEPTEEAKANLIRLCALLEAVRALINAPMILHSAYRCAAVNAAVGGSINPPSAHTQGRASDFHPGNGLDITEAFNAIRASDIQFDKLIFEHKNGSWWIHIQIETLGENPRRLVYRAELKNGAMRYTLIK